MGKYICKNCAKEFQQKSHYNVHLTRKIPCENNSKKIKALVDEEVEKKLKELDITNNKVDNKDINNQDEVNPITEPTYSELSYSLTKQINKEEKQNNGIYFTPPKTINKSLKLLGPYIDKIKTVLEPACGSCEYINHLDKQYQGLDITGIEFNETIYKAIKKFEKSNIKLCNENYLTFDGNKSKMPSTYDLIIGNPPYFVMKKNEVNKSYHEYFDGRPNIFIMFIIKSLKMLNPGGILMFILPKNFLNCLYYDKTRRHIYQHFKILNIIECMDSYIETKQETIILMLENNENVEHNNQYTLNINNYTIFGMPDKMKKLKRLYDNSETLSTLKFKVNVGNVVWNQCKDILTDDETKTRLVYSSDIEKNTLIKKKFENKEKKNHINKEGIREPIIIMNRGYGVGNYKFEYCLIDGNMEYLIENHLICVRYTEQMDKNELLLLYKKIIKSLTNEKTQQFIDLYFGNNAINTTELCEIMPMYGMK
jgi:type I restriction-modification system DNA methylase subunit